MTRVTRALGIVLAGLALGACEPPASTGFAGYVEGDYLYLAAPQAGYLQSLEVARGQRVAAGQRLFAVSAEPDAAVLREAEARAGAAQQRIDNLKAPRRLPEIGALEAELKAAGARVEQADASLGREQGLAARGFVSAARLDDLRAARDQAVAQRDAVRQQLAGYRSALGRGAEVRGAEAELEAARAVAAQRRWTVEQKAQGAPAAGQIVETYYQPGEWVPAGTPVASLLPDTARRLRFFVPEAALGGIRIGLGVEARCDGCRAPIRGVIDFIAPAAEYTPPVIYSQGRREKLVFRVEASATPEQAADLHPGQPIELRVVAEDRQ